MTVPQEEEVQLAPPKTRQLPPDQVYSRLTWSHLAHPLPQPATQQAPVLKPTLTVDFKNVEFREAIQTVARIIGYRWAYPEPAAARRVTVKVTGTIEQIVALLGRQSGLSIELDRTQRVVRAHEISPQLPSVKNPPG
jgi:hypothetical protein